MAEYREAMAALEELNLDGGGGGGGGGRGGKKKGRNKRGNRRGGNPSDSGSNEVLSWRMR